MFATSARRVAIAIITALSCAPLTAADQEPALRASQATPFLGTWVVAMTNPSGATETVKLWDQNGALGASMQLGTFPASNVTGMMKDGDMLVLTLTRRENGKPIRVVASLLLDGDTMNMAQMLEFSQTIKRGSGKKQADAQAGGGAGGSSRFPAPVQDVKPSGTEETAVLAGGCFWGVEAVFERLAGVKDVVSGFSGGSRNAANYEIVSTGTTGHAESVKITYDPTKISYGKLLEIFFAVAHDPTTLNRQGPDEGPQYRSAIFYADPQQKAVAEAYIQQLNDAKVFKHRIVTQVTKLDGFYPAENYHQNFIQKNPNYPYVVYNDLPKLQHLQQEFPELLKR
jgi:peptide-methionine (S)-S-oxide reductase